VACLSGRQDVGVEFPNTSATFPTSEKTTVNRPFSAFAALLALLTLAMFAVSSTSRSTTVQQPRQRGRSPLSSRQFGESNFVFIIPANPDGAAEKARSEGCGMQCAAEFVVKSKNANREEFGANPTLAPARILIAEQVAGAVIQTPELDCRAEHDPTDDAALSGAGQGTADPILAEAELLWIFQDLCAAQRGVPAPRARGVGRWAHVAGVQIARRAAAVEAWLNYQFGGWVVNAEPATSNSLPSDSQRLAWDDYAELIDGALAPAAATTSPASSSGVLQSVRFGDWLRHSAASSLLHCGRFLQATAIELERPSGPLTSTKSDSLAR
jgi:hypothetical protein